jgi:hypothetical protein
MPHGCKRAGTQPERLSLLSRNAQDGSYESATELMALNSSVVTPCAHTDAVHTAADPTDRSPGPHDTEDAPPNSEQEEPSAQEIAATLRKVGVIVASALRGETVPPTSLHVCLRGLHDVDCRVIGAHMGGPTLELLTSLDLSHNRIRDAGAAAIGRALGGGAPALRRLVLHENEIGCAGVAALADGMNPGGAPSLTHIRLAFNVIRDEGAMALARAWKRGGGQSLRELQLTRNAIGSNGFKALVEELHNVPELQVLSLGSACGGNLVADDGAAALEQALRMNGFRTLTVSLRHNPLSEGAKAALATVVDDCGPDIKVRT